MRDRRPLQRYTNQVLLRRLDTLFDGRRHFLRLADAEAHDAVTVADDNQSAEAQVLAAFHDLGHTIDGHDRVLDLWLRSVDLFARSVHHCHYWTVHSRDVMGRLKLQAGFTRGVGNRFDTPVIEKAVAIEHDPLDPFFHKPLCDGLPDRLGAGDVSAFSLLRERSLDRRLDARCGGDRAAGHVVDHLNVDMGDASVHSQTRPLLRTQNALPESVLDPVAAILFGLDLHSRSCRVSSWSLVFSLWSFVFGLSLAQNSKLKTSS